MRSIMVGNRKKIAVNLLLLIMGINSFVFAHSGRTDSYGGHMDNSVGIYHYHHGFSAHYHNNNECPYDTSKESNNQKDIDYFKSKYENNDYFNNTSQKKEVSDGNVYLSVFFIVVSLWIFIVIGKKIF